MTLATTLARPALDRIVLTAHFGLLTVEASARG